MKHNNYQANLTNGFKSFRFSLSNKITKRQFYTAKELNNQFKKKSYEIKIILLRKQKNTQLMEKNYFL